MPHLRDIDGAREFVRDHSDLVSVVESYGFEFNPIADDHVACSCPFHDEEEPSFAISLTKQLYTCYGCHEGGDVFSFIQKIEGLGHIEAIRFLADLASISLSEFESEATKEDKLKSKYTKVNAEVAYKLCRKAWKNKKFCTWRDGRLLDQDTLVVYGIGISNSPPRDDTIGETLGLDRRNQWVGAITVPIRDGSGRTVAFRNRMFDGPKTMGPRNDHPLDLPLVYGFYEAKKAIKEAGSVILVEGEVDVWQMVHEGFLNTIGTFGTSFGTAGLDYLAERGIREVYLLPDADKAGRKFAARVAAIHHPKLRIKIARLESGDPDESILRSGPADIQDAINHARYGIEYLVAGTLKDSTYRSQTDKIDVLLDIKPVVAAAPKIDQSLAISQLSEALEIDVASIQDFFLDVDPGETKLHDAKSERLILSQMMQDSEFAGAAIQSLVTEDFHMARHGQIYESIHKLYRDGHAVSVENIAIALERSGAESAIKVLDLIADLGASLGTGYLIDSVKEKSMRRQMVAIGKSLLSDASNPTISPDLIAQAQMSNIAQVVVGENRGVEIHALVDGVLDTMHKRMENPNLIIGHDLGEDWQSLNRTIHGLQNGRLMVLGAPSGVGKTSAMISFMSTIGVTNGTPTLCLTLETDDKTLTSRLIAHRSEVELERMATGHVGKIDVASIHAAAAQISASPLKIMQRGRTIEEAQALIRHDHMVRGTEVVFLDYVQLMGLANPGNMRRDLELGMISQGLLHIAIELNIAIVALAQLNRSGAKKFTAADHTDVAEAFKIAQDADIFMILTEKSKEEIETDGIDAGNRRAKISKNRRDGRVDVAWNMMADLDIQRIREIIT